MPDPQITALQDALIAKLTAEENIRNPAVAAAFRAVPRHHFLPDTELERVYADIAIGTKFANGRAISSSSQPAMMAIMLEQLKPQPGDNILEIGAGTGFNAALLANLVGPGGRVTSVDIEQELIHKAKNHLQTAGVSNVHLHCGDGIRGYPAHAPYDRIILTVAAPDISPAWLAQLKPDGRLLLPLTFDGPQLSIAFDRQGERLVSHSISGCGFMPLRGSGADPLRLITLAGLSNVQVITYDDALAADTRMAQTLSAWLQGESIDLPAGLLIDRGEIFSSWRLWQTMQSDGLVVIDGQLSDDISLIPFLYGADTEKPFRATGGIIAADGMAFLMRPPNQRPPKTDLHQADRDPFDLFVRGFGPQAKAVAHKLRAYLHSWDAAGRPGTDNLHIIATGRDTTAPPLPAHKQAFFVVKNWHQYQLIWPASEIS